MVSADYKIQARTRFAAKGTAMRIIGRSAEQRELKRLLESSESEFVVVYGRRRVGKTYLVREYLGKSIVFSLTGLGADMRGESSGFADQLKNFDDAVRKGFGKGREPVNTWFEAMNLLRDELEKIPCRKNGKRVVFIDEMPWLDTPKSKFVSALEHFWNSWAAAQPDIMLIVCGSATAWIMKNLLKNRQGLHNRVTSRIFLSPFTLRECEEYLNARGFRYQRKQIVDLYMVFGGVPFYLRQLQKGLSVAQNIDRLCFGNAAPLAYEFEELYHSLFRSPEKHILIARTLSAKRKGLTREEILSQTNLPAGGTLTKALTDLRQSGFVEKYCDFTKSDKGHYYKIIDPFTLFSLRFIDGGKNKAGYWIARTGSPARNAWSGFSFELVCLLHREQIKAGLGIAGVATEEFAWRSRAAEPGAQVDLVIKRRDRTINLCEMKYSDGQYRLSKEEAERIINKREAFVYETQTKYDIQVTMVTAYGVKPGIYSDVYQSEVTIESLF